MIKIRKQQLPQSAQDTEKWVCRVSAHFLTFGRVCYRSTVMMQASNCLRLIADFSKQIIRSPKRRTSERNSSWLENCQARRSSTKSNKQKWVSRLINNHVIIHQREKKQLTHGLVAWLREETDVSKGSFPSFTDCFLSCRTEKKV